MELKKYQKQVLGDLDAYLKSLEESKGLASAWNGYWSSKGLMPPQGYHDDIPGAANVCVKVPTGGGKTFIASCALKYIFDHVPVGKTRFVVWLVPSEAILSQTVANLSNPDHPYRRRINMDFSGKVNVYTKEQLLNAQNFKPFDVQENLSIAVFCYASIRANPKSKDDKKIYQENGNLLAFPTSFNDPELKLNDDTPDTALLQVIRQFNPVVVVDESHNAKSELSIAMLKNVNPSFVFAMTATPTERSNIISYVNARELKKEHMVKLPVIVYNRPDRNIVINDAVQLRGQLEIKANAAMNAGAEYLRPIVLFQAQPKTSDDSETFEKIREKLVGKGIPAEQIAIKTANKDELAKVNLLSPTCPIRYIITINALKEGWDCPFAYILASLANKTSKTDVEQIVGRVLRQPHAHKYDDAVLNLSFVLSCSADFNGTVKSVVAGLNGAGFSANDYRIADSQETETPLPQKVQPELEFVPPSDSPEEDTLDDIKEGPIGDTPCGTDNEVSPTPTSEIGTLIDDATQKGEQYDKEIQGDEDNPLTNMEIPGMKTYKIEADFVDVKDILIPQFTKEEGAGLFSGDDATVLLTEAELMEDFSLTGKDAIVNFTLDVHDAVQVDISSKGEVMPKTKNLSKVELDLLAAQFASKPDSERLKWLTTQAVSTLEKKNDYCTFSDLKGYVDTVVKALSPAVRDNLTIELLPSFVQCLSDKIERLAKEHKKQRFASWIDTNVIKCTPMYKLPASISPDRVVTHFEKTLYSGEYDDMDGDETEIINKIIAKENVRWWHRIKERRPGEFFINGHRKMYPDFLVMTESGNLVVVEVKGPHLDGTDSQEKAELGKTWADMAGTHFKYFMVFKKAGDGVPGAMLLNDFLNTLAQL